MAGILTRPYGSANHILQTLLMYLSAHALGSSELALRLPSLAGAALALSALWRIAATFRYQLLGVLAAGLVATNPIILDHLSLARGYGLALGMFLWAVLFSLERKLILAGLLVGLSIAANLTFAIPCAALSLMIVIVERNWRSAALYFAAVLVAGGPILFKPLLSAKLGEFYLGTKDLGTFVADLKSPLYEVFHRSGPGLGQWDYYYYACTRFIESWIFPAMLVLVAAACIPALSTKLHRLLGGTLLLSLLIVVGAHLVLHLLYPYQRTGLYLLALFPLGYLSAADAIWGRGLPGRVAVLPGIVLMAALLLVFGHELHAGFFVEWPYASESKELLQAVRERQTEGGKPVRIGGSFMFSYIANYYRDRYRWTWLEPMENHGLTKGFDYYFLVTPEAIYVEQLQLRKLATYEFSLLAAPVNSAHEP